MRIGMRHQFIGLLGRAVEAQRMIDIVSGAKRHAAIGAVNRGRRRVYEVPTSGVPATFEQVEKARKIGVGIGARIDQGMAHPGLRREMHDMGEAVDCDSSATDRQSAMSILSSRKLENALSSAMRASLTRGS